MFFTSTLITIAFMPAATPEMKQEFWPAGTIKREYYVRRDMDGEELQEGQDQSWYQDGQSESTSVYANGKLDGEEFQWHPNGVLKSIKHWRAGLGHGTKTEWFDNGQMWQQGELVGGLTEGSWKWWHPNGRIALDATFVHDEKAGDWYFFTDAGKPEREWHFEKPGGAEIQIDYFENGQVKQKGYRTDPCHVEGAWTRWHSNGVVAEERHYSNGDPTGIWKTYDENGNIASVVDHSKAAPADEPVGKSDDPEFPVASDEGGF